MDPRFTDRELDVMAVLWREDSATARTVHEQLDDDLAYTTVLNVLRTMADKGLVRREEEGRAHRFFPAVPREEASESALERVIAKMHGGSTDRFLAHLVSDAEINEEQLERLREELRRRFGRGEGQ